MTAQSKTAQALALQIAQAEAKVKQLKARKAKADAQARAKASKEARAADTRRKILVGAMVMDRTPPDELKKALHIYLKADRDRALFGLEPLVDQGAPAAPARPAALP